MGYVSGDGQLKLLPGKIKRSGGQLYLLHASVGGKSYVVAAAIMMGIKRENDAKTKWKTRCFTKHHYALFFNALIMEAWRIGILDEPKYINFLNHCLRTPQIVIDRALNDIIDAPNSEYQINWTDEGFIKYEELRDVKKLF